MSIENTNKVENKNEIKSTGSEFKTVKIDNSTQTISAEQLNKKPEVVVTSSSEDFLINNISKNTNRLPDEVKDNKTTSPIGQPQIDTLKDTLDPGEVKFLAGMLVGVMNKLISTILMFYANDNKDSEYKIEKESIDRLTTILTKVLEKNKVQMKMEYMFLIALAVAYSSPVRSAMKNRKIIKDAKAKLKPTFDNSKSEQPKSNLKIVKKEEQKVVTPKNPVLRRIEEDEKIAETIAVRISEGNKDWTAVELEFQKNNSILIEKFLKKIQEQEKKPNDELPFEVKEEVKTTEPIIETPPVSFEELEKISKSEKPVVDLAKEDKIIKEAKSRNPALRRKPGGQKRH